MQTNLSRGDQIIYLGVVVIFSLLLLVGCAVESVLPTLAVATAEAELGGAAPSPAPLPAPGGKCPDCGGTPNPGWLGDGRPRSDCPQCKSEWDNHVFAAELPAVPLPPVEPAEPVTPQPVLYLFLSDLPVAQDWYRDIWCAGSDEAAAKVFTIEVVNLDQLPEEERKSWRLSRSLTPAIAIYDYTAGDAEPTLRGKRATPAPRTVADLEKWLTAASAPPVSKE